MTMQANLVYAATASGTPVLDIYVQNVVRQRDVDGRGEFRV
jgi:hypothetical protein